MIQMYVSEQWYNWRERGDEKQNFKSYRIKRSKGLFE